jgi:hypothetical protein
MPVIGDQPGKKANTCGGIDQTVECLPIKCKTLSWKQYHQHHRYNHHHHNNCKVKLSKTIQQTVVNFFLRTSHMRPGNFTTRTRVFLSRFCGFNVEHRVILLWWEPHRDGSLTAGLCEQEWWHSETRCMQSIWFRLFLHKLTLMRTNTHSTRTTSMHLRPVPRPVEFTVAHLIKYPKSTLTYWAHDYST